MSKQRSRALSICIMLLFLSFLLCETTYYEYQSGRALQSGSQTMVEVRSADTVLSLVEQFLPRRTLDSSSILADLGRSASERERIGAVFLFLIALASFVIEARKGQQEQSLCQFQTFFQSLLNILHRRDGKKGGFFLCCCE